MYEYDKRVVLTLDAGGTNFVFSAIQGNNEMISPISLPAVSDNLDECLEVLVKGFDRVIAAIWKGSPSSVGIMPRVSGCSSVRGKKEPSPFLL